MKHIVTCQANAASDWLALAALKCLTEWAGLSAMKAELIWHKHFMDNPPATPMLPERNSLTTAIFEHVHVGYRCIYRHDLRVHM